MAFQAIGLTPVAVANSDAGRVWKYKYDTDSLATISASAYFSTADTGSETAGSIGITGNRMGLTDEDVIILMASDGIGIITINVTTDGVISAISSFMSGGNATTVTASTLSPLAVDNGRTYYLSRVAGVAVTLPAPALGLKFKFVHVAPVLTSVGHIITAKSAAAANATIIFGSHCSGGVISLGATEDTITFVSGTSIIGDYIEIESDGTNWYANGLGSTTQAITLTDEA